MKFEKFVFCGFLAAVFLSGCIFLPQEYAPTSYYDIGVLPDTCDGLATISAVKNSGPYKTNMVFRKKNNQLHIDNYSKWIQSPEKMARRYLISALGRLENESSPTCPKISMDILVFEADCSGDKNFAVLSVNYDIEFGKAGKCASGISTFRSEMKDISATAFAEAMTANMADLSNFLKEKIKKIKQEQENK